MLPLYSAELPLLLSMTLEHSEIFVTLDKSLKIPSSWKMNYCIHNHSPTAFSTSELLSLPGVPKSIRPLNPLPHPASICWTNRLQSLRMSVRQFPNSLFHFLTCFTHHCAIMTHLRKPAVNVGGGGTCFSLKATDHTTDVFVGPHCRCHCTSTYRPNSI